jgi:hypothetical protein
LQGWNRKGIIFLKGINLSLSEMGSRLQRYVTAALLASLPLGIGGGWIYSMQVAQAKSHHDWELQVRREVRERLEKGETNINVDELMRHRKKD